MNFILDIIRGAVIGIANIIPGVSGGTMMVAMGLYDKLIHAITHLKKEFLKSLNKKIETLHVSDYDFINERHWLCGEGKIDWLSLKKRGVPENADFAVRFLSDVPIVVSHPDHTPAYTARDN